MVPKNSHDTFEVYQIPDSSTSCVKQKYVGSLLSLVGIQFALHSQNLLPREIHVEDFEFHFGFLKLLSVLSFATCTHKLDSIATKKHLFPETPCRKSVKQEGQLFTSFFQHGIFSSQHCGETWNLPEQASIASENWDQSQLFRNFDCPTRQSGPSITDSECVSVIVSRSRLHTLHVRG